MNEPNTLINTDFYKVEHHRMMPEGTSALYSNMTPRKSRIPGINHVVVFKIQHFVWKYLINHFSENFFQRTWKDVSSEYSKFINVGNLDHIKALHSLGYLPLRIKALPEGTLCPIGVPLLTITNTLPEYSWLVNYLETLMSTSLWQSITSATLAHRLRVLLDSWADRTGANKEFVPWQGHDFSMRGMSSLESAVASGMGHLLSFTGTDTIPAIYELADYYPSESVSGYLIGASIPATEHSIECMHYDYETGSEDAYLTHLLKMYPTGPVAAVFDGFDLFKGIVETVPKHHDAIMSRDGKLIFRPDSGKPVDIVCGTETFLDKHMFETEIKANPDRTPEQKGVIELLWEQFGGTINDKGFKVLDPHVGCIYGDSMNYERINEICERLHDKGFSSENMVFGVGSYHYQMVTRDTFGFAVKATYGEITDKEGNVHPRVIWKDPKTDDGTKKSAKGLLRVDYDDNGKIALFDNQTLEQEQQGLLQIVFEDGVAGRIQHLDEIRDRLKVQDPIELTV